MKTYKSLILRGLLALPIIVLVGCTGAKAPEASESADVAVPKPVSVVDDAGRSHLCAPTEHVEGKQACGHRASILQSQ